MTTHGQAKSPTYTVWGRMKNRCYNPNTGLYKNYGGRGIQVCERWRESFANFVADMGERPPGTSIDRINNDGNYEPSNCRWATSKEQNNNTRRSRNIEYQGETKTLMQWSEHLGIKYQTLKGRIRNRWPTERLLTPARVGNYGKLRNK